VPAAPPSLSHKSQTVSDRDFVIEFCSHALAGLHLSRLAEECLWASSDLVSSCWVLLYTGSFVDAAKENPDGRMSVESGRVWNLMRYCHAQGLPMSYNRDLQGTKSGFVRQR